MTSQRRDFAGAAVQTALTTGINSSDTTITINSAVGWSIGTNGPFYVVIDPGLAGEEKVLILSRSGTTLTVVTSPSTGRGADGTTAGAHSAAAVIYPCVTAIDLDDANDHIYTTGRDDHTQYLNNTRHDTPTRHGDTTLGIPSAASDIGTAASAGTTGTRAYQNHVHKIGAAAINSPALFAAGTVDTAALAANSVTSAKIVDGTIVSADIASATILAANIAGGTITTTQMADAAITSAKIADATIVDADIAGGTITRAKLASDAQKSVDVAWGYIDSALSNTDQTGISTGATITNLQVTLTAVANRRYRTTVHIPRLQQISSAGEVQVEITDGSNVRVTGSNEPLACVALAASGVAHADIVLYETTTTAGGAGAHTRRVRISTSAGTVNVPGSTHQALAIVEDIGPS